MGVSMESLYAVNPFYRFVLELLYNHIICRTKTSLKSNLFRLAVRQKFTEWYTLLSKHEIIDVVTLLWKELNNHKENREVEKLFITRFCLSDRESIFEWYHTF